MRIYSEPAPADLAKMAKTLNRERLRHHYAVSNSKLDRWLKQTGVVPVKLARPTENLALRRPVPSDFAKMAATMHQGALQRHYSTSNDIIRRWCQEAGVRPAAPPTKPRVPMPQGFAKIAPTMTKNGLAKHYGCSHDLIDRWLSEAGVKSRAAAYSMAPTRGSVTPFVGQRSKTMFDMAADTLRRERWTVYRCTETGRADPSGDWWRVGNVVVSPDDLLRRAARYERRAA